MKQLESQLDEALRCGQAAEAHRIARLISGTGIGVRKVKMGHIVSHRMDEEETHNYATRCAKEGGLGAKIINCTEEKKQWLEAPNEIFSDAIHWKMARADVHDTVRALIHTSERRSTPPWSAPGEAFLMALAPSYTCKLGEMAGCWTGNSEPKGPG